MRDKGKGRKSKYWIFHIRKYSELWKVFYFDYVHCYFVVYLRAALIKRFDSLLRRLGHCDFIVYLISFGFLIHGKLLLFKSLM